MSWLFGVSPPKGVGSNPPPKDPPKDKDNKDESVYKFDSAALERAAQAAKQLEKSAYAKEAFELAKGQENTLQLEHQVKIKEYEAGLAQIQVEKIRVQADENRKTLIEDSKIKKSQADYQDLLARKRNEDQMSLKLKTEEETLRRQEESVKKQEAMRRSNIEYEAELRLKNDMKLLEARGKAEALQERENHEIRLAMLHEKAKEDRETMLESIKTAGSVIGNGFVAFISNWDRVVTTVGAMTLLACGVYGAKYGLHTTTKFIESRIGKPSLVRETCRLNAIDAIKFPIKTAKQLLIKPKDTLEGIILKPMTEEQCRQIAIANRYTKVNKGFYRNVLFTGPPGTGKTMFAKSLARHSGMDYAIMSGGDVAPLKSDAATAINKVFDWARTSRRGVVLFVDEADAFLCKRNQERMSEEMRTALNTFLFRTGEQSKNMMLVFATNLPEHFDPAVKDRIDEVVSFDLPTLAERERLVRHYFDLYILQQVFGRRSRIRVEEGMDYSAKCSDVARRTEGLSGREISKLVITWQTRALSSPDGVLTEKIMNETIEKALADHNLKVAWEGDSNLTPPTRRPLASA